MSKLVVLAAALGLSGCGGPKHLPVAATPDSSRDALAMAFEAWKQGKTEQEMSESSPSLYFPDDDLRRGAKLLEYRIEGDGHLAGTGYSYIVRVKIQDKDGSRTRDKKIAYRVVTEPKIAITREDRQP
jgi:predicted small lipoprotein YifL